jgi:FkbM family methyltransferase
VQIGAFDGQVADPLADILRLENVSAVLVEPQTIPYKALVAHYEGNLRMSLVNAAVAESDGEVILYVPSSRESPKASLIAGHHRRFGVMAREVRQVAVPSMSVASLLEAYQIEHVHILQIDTEGMDYDVLNWFFDADVQPAMINFENLHLGRRERSASRELLRTTG